LQKYDRIKYIKTAEGSRHRKKIIGRGVGSVTVELLPEEAKARKQDRRRQQDVFFEASDSYRKKNA
jgi:hypothetical protein